MANYLGRSSHKIMVDHNSTEPAGFVAVVNQLLRAIDYRIFFSPLLIAALVCYAVIAGYYRPGKSVLEAVGLVVISCVLLLCLLRYWRERSTFTLGCVWMAFVFCSREIHYYGSDHLLYLSIMTLAYLVVTRYAFFRPYIQNRICFSIFAAAFLAYIFSQTVDQRWWRALPYEKLVQNKLEETMEIVGHLYLGAALLLWKESSRKDQPVQVGAGEAGNRQRGEETA